MTDTKTEKFAVTKEERAKFRGAVTAKYGVYLKPGESLAVDVQRDAEHASVELILTGDADSLRVTLEAAVLGEDAHKAEPDVKDRLYIAFDFLDAMFEEFMKDDREGRFHDDWRVYDSGDYIIRFRGKVSRPDLEALADAWLSSDGEPEGA